ncbi:MAG: GIY-YIG nuclease family protein [Ignavibacteriales bacterium]|nr:GIY-YIG nuclease family protein [Ignavibacteriales bacterium]
MGRYTLYILYSRSLDRHYIGHTNDFSRRLAEHNSRHTRSTRGGAPWVPRLTRDYPTKAEAHAEERRLKRLKSRKYIEEYIEEFSHDQFD